ncbi:MAG TPA: glycosyltransferase family 2 protein [Bacteroidia bacterium]|nr:glycosyltransferase family 2 protein [Bacteroidia bacterium]
MSSRLSVIIVSYNVRELLSNCLVSLRKERTDFAVEIIVVDNCSTDGTDAMMHTDFSDVIFIGNGINRGFSGANNQGFEAATGTHFFMLNPDTEVKPGALQKLMDRCVKQERLCIVGPKLLNSDGTLQRSAWKVETVWHYFLDIFYLRTIVWSGLYPEKKFSREFHPEAMSGAALFFPQKLYKVLGGLDPVLFWMEDTDFCYRAEKAGAGCLFFPGAEVVHHVGQSAKQNLKVTIPNQLISKLKFWRKHRSRFTVRVAKWICFIIIITRIALFTLLAAANGKYRAKREAYIYALNKWYRFFYMNDNSLL